jgi:hypothetical protein
MRGLLVRDTSSLKALRKINEKMFSKTYATKNAFANHLLSNKHIELTAQQKKDEEKAHTDSTDKGETDPQPKEHKSATNRKRQIIDIDENADEKTMQEQLVKKFETATRLTDSQCLFCSNTEKDIET